MDRRKFIPSMFHRRLVLVAATMFIVMLIMGGQLFRLAVVEGQERRAEAESRLDRRTFIPTYRGRILDRNGRVLAQDRASYAIAVQYEVISGAWVRNKARRQAVRDLGRSNWGELSPEQREAAIEARIGEFADIVEALWVELCATGDLPRTELDARLNAIRDSVEDTREAVWARQKQRAIREYGEEAGESFEQRPIREERIAHVVLPNVPDDVAFHVRSLIEQDEHIADMIEVHDDHRREYPWLEAEVVLERNGLPRALRRDDVEVIRVRGVADHIMGGIRNDVYAEDIERRPFFLPEGQGVDLHGYRVGDFVGSTGLEAVFEDHLRGARGEIRERMDTGETVRIEPAPGQDLMLTLDIRLQTRVQAILMPAYGLARVQQWHAGWDTEGQTIATKLPIGRPLNAAAVVLDVDSGEVLAAVSMPSIAEGTQRDDNRQRFDRAIINRPFEAVYPPGSIIKPIVLAAAVHHGEHSLSSPIECTGHYFPNRTGIARCWIYRERYGLTTHGSLLAEEALARSCNIYFYTLSDRLGMKRMVQWYRGFGLGRYLDCGLLRSAVFKDGRIAWVGESRGDLPNDTTIAELRARGDLRFLTVIMGIGQGQVTWTPMQAANAYAILARGGVIRDPTLLLTDPRPPANDVQPNVPIATEVVTAALEGLRQSVEETHGTGHHIRYADRSTDPIFNVPNTTLWAKTGTAQAPPVDVDGDGTIAPHERNFEHAWTVGLVGPEGDRPRYAIAVVVEHGGSGGRVAGPIVNEIIRALQVEGYLPAPEPEA